MNDLFINGYTFQKTVRVADWEDERNLVFINCQFEAGFSANRAKTKGGITFIKCDFSSLTDLGSEDIALDLQNAWIGDSLQFMECSLAGRFYAAGLHAEGNVELAGCRIAPKKSYVGKAVRVDEIRGAKLDIDILLKGLNWFTEEKESELILIDFTGARIEGQLTIGSAGNVITRGTLPETFGHCPASVIAGNISCRQISARSGIGFFGTIVFGKVDFIESEVIGKVSLHWCSLRNRTGDGLDFTQATINGNIWLGLIRIQASVSLYRTAVTGNFFLESVHCAKDLDVTFASIKGIWSYFSYETFEKTGEVLRIDGNFILSGAKIDVIEMRAAQIRGRIESSTGEFGTVRFKMGIKESGNDGGCWPAFFRVTAIQFRAIKIRDELSLGGVQVHAFEESALQSQRKTTVSGFELADSTIEGFVSFYCGDKFVDELEKRWGSPEQIAWIDPDLPINTQNQRQSEQTHIDEIRSPKQIARPKPNRFQSQITGNCVIRACPIGGNLDLRNLRVANGGIDLSFSSVNLDVKTSRETRKVSDDSGDIQTVCCYLEGKKLVCNGDMDLRALKAIGIQQEGEKISNVEDSLAGNISFRAAILRGDLLLATKEETNDEVKGGVPQAPENTASGKETCAIIEGTLDLSDASCAHLVVSGRSFENRKKRVSPPANLERGVFKRLEIRHRAPYSINFKGIKVDNWELPGDDEKAETYIKVLSVMDPMDRSVWIAVETDLRNRSLDWESNKIYLAMMKRAGQIEAQKGMCLRRYYQYGKHHFEHWVQWFFLGIKSHVEIPFIAVIVTFVMLTCIFKNPENVCATPDYIAALPPEMSRTNDVVELSECTSLTNTVPKEIHPMGWGWNDAASLALRYHIPVFEGRTHKKWEASDEKQIRIPWSGWRTSAETVAFIVELIYWVLFPLFLLGFVKWGLRQTEDKG